MSRSITPEQLREYTARVEVNEADVEAWFWVGYCPFFGTGGVELDDEEAVRIWRRVLRDFGNDEDVQDGTGKIRFRLDLYHQAVPRLQWEAAQGDSQSQIYLALCFRDRSGGLEQDRVQAAYWFERSAEQGNALAQYHIGVCYRDGDGVERYLVKAVEWFNKAIAQGSGAARRCRRRLMDALDETERDRVLGIVQRNKWFENVQQSVNSAPPLAVWALALEKLVGTQNKWASLSPMFFCLKVAAVPLLLFTEKLEGKGQQQQTTILTMPAIRRSKRERKQVHSFYEDAEKEIEARHSSTRRSKRKRKQVHSFYEDAEKEIEAHAK